ncbi:flagellar export chaperone FliS [Lederbergia sp. NSJ-179]|uniref:flagellar export chaperone FliS n=1 Tax=Lederbergia sp. NSJ-179 TaxID=2931402 RepID=UPI001FCFFF09|nr:flagellar export chaperone FliS [Lederbergia sp. NSJ-179]MCJ7840174.1 flagellar export chaperone FliS [Lederbergia sp. NSJ-179]
MASANPYQTYQKNSVTTAAPGELTLMLYNGCLKFIYFAKDAMGKNNIEVKNTNIQKAQNIINELMVTLNMELDLSRSMMSLYEYAYRRLIEANIKNNLEALIEVEEIIKEFRDTWKQAIQLNRQHQHVSGSSGI